MALKAGFLIGGDTNETPQSLARKRALIAQIMANGRAPTNIGEGLNALGDGIVANVLERRASEAEKAGQASANEAFAPIAAMFTGGGFGGMGGTSAPAASAPSSAPSPAGQPPVPGIQAQGGGNFDSVAPRLISDLSRDFGLSSEQAAGIVGQLGHESAGFGTLQEVKPMVPGSRGGFGYAQWTGPRRKDFEAWSAQNNLDPTSYEANYGFLAHELKNTPEGRALDQVRSAPDALSAGRVFTDTFLRPGIPGYESRDRWTQKALAFAGQQPASAAEAVTAMGQGGQMPAPQAAAYVDPMVVNPNSRPQAMAPQQGPARNGLPFDLVSGSPQLARADTRQGILRALTGQTGPEPGATGAFPAAPVSAPMATPQAAPAPSMAAPAPMQVAPAAASAPQPMAQPQISSQQLIAAINNPWLSDSQRAIAQSMLEQQMQANDPMRQLEIKKAQLEIDQMQNPNSEFITGRDGSIFKANPRTGQLEQVYGGKPEMPTDVQEYQFAVGQGYKGTFADWQLENKRAGASQVNIDQKAEGAFDKKLAENQATTFDTLATDGMNARADLAVIEELGSLMAGRGGTLDGFSGALAKYGIGGEGVGDIQAAQALINRLVPTQRAPGSGSMSDRDVELFTRSLPSLWNTPGGNERILNTMRGLAQYKQAQGDIAQRVLAGELDRREATKMLRELPNPLAGFKPEAKADENSPASPNGTQPPLDDLLKKYGN